MKKPEIKPGQGKRLKECIRAAGMTQEKLAEAIYTTPQTVSKIVNERVPISYENAYLISRVLKVRLEYLLLEDDYMTEAELFRDYETRLEVKGRCCEELIESLGFAIVTTKEMPDGTAESMHRPYKKLVIFSDDSESQILKKAESTESVCVYELNSPDGRSTFIEAGEYMQLIRDIEDYAKMKLCTKFQRYQDDTLVVMGVATHGNH